MALKNVENIVESFLDDILKILGEEELELLRITKNRLAKGIDKEGWAENKLSQIQDQKKELVAAQVDATNKVNILIREQHEQAYTNGYKFGIADGQVKKYLTTGKIKVPAKVRALIMERAGVLKNQQITILRSSLDAYRDIVADVSSKVLLGTQTRQQALQVALNKFADKGITSFVDKSGRNWNLTTYTEMATRTSTMNANRLGAIDRNLDAGRDLVIVSAHGICCPLCAPYEGQVLSISGSNRNYPSYATAVADGLFHPNCRHTVTGYVRGITKVNDKLEGYKPEQYAITQQQRSNERMIRKWKNRKEVSINPVSKSEADLKIRLYQKKQREMLKNYKSQYGEVLKRRYERESIKRIGRKGVEKVQEVTKKVVEKIDFSKMNKKQLSKYAVDNLKFSKIAFGKKSDDVARGIVEQTKRFYDDFPEYAGFTTEIKNTTSRSIYGSYGNVKASSKITVDARGLYNAKTAVRYSETVMDNLDDVVKRYSSDVKSGHSPLGTKWTDVIIHENTHGLERFMNARKMGIDDRMGELTRDEISKYVRAMNNGLLSREIRDEALSNLGIKIHKDIYDATVDISRYATTNSKETLAEAFADVYANGSNAKPLSKEMVKITKKKYKELMK